MASYRFGRFRVDTHEHRLTRDGEPMAITPKVFDTLLVFLRHAGRLLTKDQLLQEVWPGTAVEEANLTVNVSTLRKLLADVKGVERIALGENEDRARVVVVVAGRGFTQGSLSRIPERVRAFGTLLAVPYDLLPLRRAEV